MGECFEFTFAFHRLGSRLEDFGVNETFGSVDPSISRPDAVDVESIPFVYVFGVACVVATVNAL